MRIAVQCPDDHPVSPGAVFAYRLGRVEDGVHNHQIHTGETVPVDDFMQALLERAQEEYPDHEVRVERLVDNGDGTSTWIPAAEYDPEQHRPVGAGDVSRATELHVNAGQVGG